MNELPLYVVLRFRLVPGLRGRALSKAGSSPEVLIEVQETLFRWSTGFQEPLLYFGPKAGSNMVRDIKKRSKNAVGYAYLVVPYKEVPISGNGLMAPWTKEQISYCRRFGIVCRGDKLSVEDQA